MSSFVAFCLCLYFCLKSKSLSLAKKIIFILLLFLSMSLFAAPSDFDSIPAEIVPLQGCKLESVWAMQFYGSSATAASKSACASIVYAAATTEEHHVANKLEQWSLTANGDSYFVKFYKPATNRWSTYEITFYDAGTDFHCPNSDYPDLDMDLCVAHGRVCGDGYYAVKSGNPVSLSACDRPTPIVNPLECLYGSSTTPPEWGECISNKPDYECDPVYFGGIKHCIQNPDDVCQDIDGVEVCADGCGYVDGTMPDGTQQSVYYCSDKNAPNMPDPDSGHDNPTGNDDNGDGKIDNDEIANAHLSSINERVDKTNELIANADNNAQKGNNSITDLLSDIVENTSGNGAEPEPEPEPEPPVNLPSHRTTEFKNVNDVMTSLMTQINNAPLISAVSNFSNVKISKGQCPILRIDLTETLINRVISTDLHCTIFETIRQPLRAVCMSVFGFLAFRTFAEA